MKNQKTIQGFLTVVSHSSGTMAKKIQKQYVNISMPVYVTKQLKKYNDEVSKRPKHAPYPSAPNKYSAEAQ